MTGEQLCTARSRAAETVGALVEHCMALLACADLLAAEGHETAARQVRRSLMRATMALHALREELVTIEIIERCLRTYARGRPPPS